MLKIETLEQLDSNATEYVGYIGSGLERLASRHLLACMQADCPDCADLYRLTAYHNQTIVARAAFFAGIGVRRP